MKIRIPKEIAQEIDEGSTLQTGSKLNKVFLDEFGLTVISRTRGGGRDYWEIELKETLHPVNDAAKRQNIEARFKRRGVEFI